MVTIERYNPIGVMPTEGEPATPKLPLNIVLPFTKRDTGRVREWMEWCFDLCGFNSTQTLWLMPFKDLVCSSLIILAQRCFDRVRQIEDVDGIVSKWTEDGDHSDSCGPNSMFRQAVWHFHFLNKGPWLWCEPDCIPLKPDWITRLETEYYQIGLPFMGAVCGEGNWKHMNGAGIYPASCPIETNEVMRRESHARQTCFDVLCGRNIVPKAHPTKLIQFVYPAQHFSSKAEVDAFIDPNAVLFHSCRDSSLIKYLCQDSYATTE